MDDNRYFGLTPTQLNLVFFAVVGAVAIAGFVYAGGVGAVREYLGDEEPTTQPAVNATDTAEPTPESQPAEEPEAPAEEPAPQPPCTQFTALCEASVVNTGSTGLNVRDAPSINGQANEYFQLHDGETIVIEGGPVQADGYTWWQMWLDLGWVAEGDGATKWLIPAEEESSCPVGMNGCGEPDESWD